MLTASVSLLHFGVRGARNLRKRLSYPQLEVKRYVNLTYRRSTLPDATAHCQTWVAIRATVRLRAPVPATAAPGWGHRGPEGRSRPRAAPRGGPLPASRSPPGS